MIQLCWILKPQQPDAPPRREISSGDFSDLDLWRKNSAVFEMLQAVVGFMDSLKDIESEADTPNGKWFYPETLLCQHCKGAPVLYCILCRKALHRKCG